MGLLKNSRFISLVILLAVLMLCVEVFADQAQVHFEKGHKFYLEFKPEQAEAEFKKALQLNFQILDARYYLSSIYFKQDRYAQAIEQCQKALELDPGDIKSLIILGLSFQQIELLAQAISVFKKAVGVDAQSVAAHSALGLAYCANGDVALAKEEYHILKKIDRELAEDLLRMVNEVIAYGTK